MDWTVKLSEEAKKDLRKLDKPVRKKISDFIDRLPSYPTPRSIGSALKGKLSGQWRYRVGDYRIICRLHDDILLVEAIQIGHRSDIYKE